MNLEDSEQLQLQLENLGYSVASTIHEAEVVLLNTCSVRKKPEDKAFSFLGELAILKKSRPGLIIGVCGCMAQIRSDEILRRAPHVDFILGTGDLSQLEGLVVEAAQGKNFQKRLKLPARKGAIVTDVPQRQIPHGTKLKAFVPIQYGCDKFCTFCIVPTTRGRERSRPVNHILTEVRQLANQGTKEICLLGQTVNSYGKNLADGKTSFSSLLRQLAEIDGLERIRYISPYPRDFTAELIETICECPKVMEHCHLPIQAGHDALLKRMHRLYSVNGFLEIVENLRTAVPGIGLTTDIIVGFPGETEEEFEATLEIVRQVKFDGAYCFAYSPRPGTPAASMEQVQYETKMIRLNQLIELQNQITAKINVSLEGQIFEVLVENKSNKNPGFMQGHTRENRFAQFKADSTIINQLAQFKVIEGYHGGLHGELV